MRYQPVYTDTVKVRIYLEGVLFPYAKSVVVTQSEGKVSAQISVPPSTYLRPEQWAGMTCHIFYANKRVLKNHSENRLPSDWFDKDSATAAIEDKGWPILFQGEMAGESSQKTVQSENIILNFVGHSRHFEQTIQYFVDPSNFKFDDTRQAFIFGNTQVNMDMNGLPSKSFQILANLAAGYRELQDEKGQAIAFTSMVFNMLREIGEGHAIYGHFDRKFRLSQRFAAFADPDVANVLALEKMAILIDKRAKALPPYTSIMKVFNLATGMMRYNWNHIAQPQFRRNMQRQLAEVFEGSTISGNDAQAVQEAIGLDVSNSAGEIEEIEEIRRQIIASYTQKSGFTLINLEQGNLRLPPDFADRTQALNRQTWSDTVIRFLESEGSPLAATQAVIDRTKLRPEGIRRQNSEVEKDPKTEDAIPSKEEIAASLQRPEEGSDITADFNKRKEVFEVTELEQKALRERDELMEFVVTPNLRFAQPPACNVILPYSISTFGIQRDMFREPTRLYGRVPVLPSESGGDKIINWYVAPVSQAFHYLSASTLSQWNDQYSNFLKSNYARFEPEDAKNAAPGTPEPEGT